MASVGEQRALVDELIDERDRLRIEAARLRDWLRYIGWSTRGMGSSLATQALFSSDKAPPSRDATKGKGR